MQKDLGDFNALEGIVARLRAPDGCPWDREQTHSSIKPYLEEEAYEVLQALDEQDTSKLCEELGDLLLQILLHAQIARESGEFEMRDVIRGIATKLIRRHPHVFGEAPAGNARDVALEWEILKGDEREAGRSVLDGAPKAMPALSYSHSIQRRAAGVGFDWPEYKGILDKLVEEVGELRRSASKREKIHEFGDILFALVNAARWQDVNLEEALRLANERFYRRFRHMEEECSRRNRVLRDLSFDEQNALWEEAKSKVG
ncbi:MAG: nucleoside triphosphate pyrophosphohydrolase [Dehalococcoidia bacterium]|nr:nucleoside triphosphate pyrophosphohydrolase [Dehalococcoidia bacterium]